MKRTSGPTSGPSGKKRPPRATKPVRAARRPWYLTWYFWVTIVAVVGVMAWRLLPPPQNPPQAHGPRAAIVDQLYGFGYSNPYFIESATDALRDAGFEVDLYQGKDVTTVATYKKILSESYALVIFRAHSGLIQTEGEPMRTSIFTSEDFSAGPFSCSSDVAGGRLVKARVAEGDPFYFAITADFVKAHMSGLKNSVVILSGCSGLSPYNTDMAEAFIGKGARAYLGWDGSVDLDYVDRASLAFIEAFCQGDCTLAEAVDEAMHKVGEDPRWGSRLGYFPDMAATTTVADVVATSL